jgi:hypothetical protein
MAHLLMAASPSKSSELLRVRFSPCGRWRWQKKLSPRHE